MSSIPNNLIRYNGVRVRLQRLSDGRFASGWITKLCKQYVGINISPNSMFRPDDLLRIEMFAQGRIGAVQAKVVGSNQSEIIAEMFGQLQEIPCHESARMIAHDLKCKILADGPFVIGTVLDVSEGGAGILIPQSYTKGSEIRIGFDTAVGEIWADAEIRYCRKDVAYHGFRLGIEFKDLDRTTRSRWRHASGLAID